MLASFERSCCPWSQCHFSEFSFWGYFAPTPCSLFLSLQVSILLDAMALGLGYHRGVAKSIKVMIPHCHIIVPPNKKAPGFLMRHYPAFQTNACAPKSAHLFIVVKNHLVIRRNHKAIMIHNSGYIWVITPSVRCFANGLALLWIRNLGLKPMRKLY